MSIKDKVSRNVRKTVYLTEKQINKLLAENCSISIRNCVAENVELKLGEFDFSTHFALSVFIANYEYK